MRIKILLEKIPHVVYLFTGLIILFSFVSPNFFSIGNLSNVILQGSVLLIISLGLTLVMLSNGIDLSVGSLMSLCGMVAGMSLSKGLGLIPALFFGILTGLASGLFIGFLVTQLRFSPFIATFGMMGVFEGISLFSNKGESIYWSESVFNFIGSGYLFNVPFPVWLAALTFVIVYVLLYKTPFGVNVYAIGGHEEGLRLSGVNVKRQKVMVYMVSGLLAGIGGIVLSSRIASGHPTVGIGYEFEAIASSVIGGTTFFGGQGGIVGTLFGALMITLLRNGLNLLGYTTPYQYCAIGVILAVGITLNTMYKR
ncbi:MAG: ABC transporter permease [Desulfobacterales bacterium]|nr:ABC transporter permease [Desulfobacterales bacterium]